MFRAAGDVLGHSLLTDDGPGYRRQRRIVQPLFTARQVARYAPLMLQEAAWSPTPWQDAGRAGHRRPGGPAPARHALHAAGRRPHPVRGRRGAAGAGARRADARGRRRDPPARPAGGPGPDAVAHAAQPPAPAAAPGAAGGGAGGARRLRAQRPGPRTGRPRRPAVRPAADPERRRRPGPAGGPRPGAGVPARRPRDDGGSADVHAAPAGLPPQRAGRRGAELDSVLGAGAGAARGWPTPASCRGTRAALQEAMRLYPPAYAVDRSPRAPLQLAGHLVPPGTVLAHPRGRTHRHPGSGPTPSASTPGGSSAPRSGPVTRTSPSAEARAAASASTSPCSKPRSCWPRCCAATRFRPSPAR